MFFGKPYNAALCCGRCPAEAVDFHGGWWGLHIDGSNVYATRLPSFVADPAQVLHSTDRVLIPNLTKVGVEYQCVGMAGSQVGDGSWFAPATQSVVWYQLHYAPVSDLNTTTPRAALACIKIGDHTTGAQESDPLNHECTLIDCWLVNDEIGSVQYWDDPRKLCHYYDNWDEDDGYARKTVVGPGHFAFQIRRLFDGTQDRIIYYAIGQETPATINYFNNESGTWSAWQPLFFSSCAFPMALWSRCESVNYHGSGRLENLRRQYRHAKALLAPLAVDDSDVSANNPAFDAYWAGENAIGSDIVLSDTALYVLDYEINGRYIPSFTTDGGSPVTFWLNAAEETFGAGPYQGINLDSVPELSLVGTNYLQGGSGIFVCRESSGTEFGFVRSGFSAKPAWTVHTALSYAAGEAIAIETATDDDPVWRANDREVFRVFGRRHNGWEFTPAGFGGLVGPFYTTTETGIFTDPAYGVPPMGEAPLYVAGYDTVVQACPENFFERPTSGDFNHDPAIAVVNWPAYQGEAQEVYLDYVTHDAWFWRGGDVIAPLWRVSGGGLVANTVGTSGWIYVDGVKQFGGVLAFDSSIDELTESMADSVPPA